MNLTAGVESFGSGWEPGTERPEGVPTMADLATSIRGRVPKERASGTYGFALWLGVITMVGIPGVYAALLVYLSIALLRGTDDWLAWVTQGAGGWVETGWRTALFLGGLGLGVAMLGCLLRPFFVKPAGRTPRLALSPVTEPLLFGFIHMVCDALGVPRPDRVEVDCRMNASAGLRRGAGSLVSNAWVLTLGLPLVAGLGVTEFSGILAHELGHLGQGWGLRACHVVRRMGEWLEAAAGRAKSEDLGERWDSHPSGAVHRLVASVLRLGVMLSQGVVGLLRGVCMGVNHHLLRQMEGRADRVQIEWVGSDAFERTYRRLCVLAGVRRDVYRDLKRRWDAGAPMPGNLPEEWVKRADQVSEETAERWFAGLMERERDGWDPHPSDAARIERARAAGKPGLFHFDGRASGLFSNFAAVATQVTSLHYREDLKLGGLERGELGSRGTV